MDKINQICFPQNTFNIYLFLLFITIFFVSYYIICLLKNKHVKDNNNINSDLIQLLKDQISNQQEQEKEHEKISTDIPDISDKIFLNKIYNPLISPSPLYPGGSFSTPTFDGYRQFQQLGYLTSSTGQFPVMGRYKYRGNTNKYEYQCLNEGRNRVKIQFKNKNDNELYDGDSVNIPELGGELIFKKYEDTDNNRYDPTVI